MIVGTVLAPPGAASWYIALSVVLAATVILSRVPVWFLLKRLAWLAPDSEAGQEYWGAMELMGRYAAANHALIHRHVAANLGAEVLLVPTIRIVPRALDDAVVRVVAGDLDLGEDRDDLLGDLLLIETISQLVLQHETHRTLGLGDAHVEALGRDLGDRLLGQP